MKNNIVFYLFTVIILFSLKCSSNILTEKNIDAENNLTSTNSLPPAKTINLSIKPNHEHYKISSEFEVFSDKEFFLQPSLICGISDFNKRIEYPEIALRGGIEGKLIINFRINNEGIVDSTVVLESPWSGLSNSVIAALKKTGFLPAMVEKVSTDSWMNLSVSFKILDHWHYRR